MGFEIYKETLTPHVTYDEAVKICENLGNGWRLPTIDELILMNEQQNNGLIYFGNYGCWSSNQFDNGRYYSLGFLTGNIYINEKNNKNLIRPVRDGNNVDKNYWSSELPRPLSPDDNDVLLYENYKLSGTTLLLGCTRKLIPITDNQMDIDPWHESESVIIGDWRKNNKFYDNIIGDGVLNFTEELANDIVSMASNNCKRLIIRCFTKKLPTMRIANYFPMGYDLKIPPQEIKIMGDYAFYVWEF